MPGYGSNVRRNRDIRTKDGFLLLKEINNWNGQSSPRRNGKLQLCMNPYNRSYRHEEWGMAIWPDGFQWTGEHLYSYFRPNQNTALSQREIDNCTLDFYNEVNGMATNLLDAVRQRQQTVDMITSNAMKLYRSMSLLRKGKWKKAANALGVSPKGSPRGRDVPARWLELQYGWLPLLGDIYTVGNEFFPEPKFRVKKSVYSELNISTANHYGSCNLSLNDRYSIVGYFAIEGVTLPTMQHLGVLNPLGVMWEAVPFSFVVDWFLPVGDWISALTALSGVDMRQTSVMRVQKSVRIGLAKTEIAPGNWLRSPVKEEIYSYQRTVGLPSRPFPSFKNPLSVGHFANAMSLIATIFGKKRQN